MAFYNCCVTCAVVTFSINGVVSFVCLFSLNQINSRIAFCLSLTYFLLLSQKQMSPGLGKKLKLHFMEQRGNII